MSDDQHNNPQHPSGRDNSQNYGQEDDKTQMVDLNELKGAPEPQFAPPPIMESSEATQLFEIPPSMGNQDGDEITSSAPDYGNPSYGQNAPPPVSSSQDFGSGPVSSGNPFGSGPVSSGNPFGSGPVNSNMGGGHQQPSPPAFAPSPEDAGYEGSTQFVNIADFAKKEAHFTPEQQQAGYDGNTQFVDINALQAGGPAGASGDSISSDADLQRGYDFHPNDIQQGEVTTIQAKNPLGNPVILKRVWEGDPQSMSTPLRERVAQLHALRHPNLVPMNGMFVSQSGMWVELDAPRGQSLTNILQSSGPQNPVQVMEWIMSIASVLETIHSQQLAYANLTTDAVWIDMTSGNVQIEPFDMLRLADRGNLGAFGPPEMDAPPDQRQLSPATDVFSLSAVGAAALTGLPFQPQKLAQFSDEKLADKLALAMAPNPNERPQSAMEFATTLKGGDGLDIKLVAGAGIGVVLLLIILAAVFSGGDDPTDQVVLQEPAAQGEPSQDVDQLIEMAAASNNNSDSNSNDNSDNNAPASAVDLPGQTTADRRLSISTSFAKNPPTTAVRRVSEEELDAWREEAQEAIAEGEDAPRSSRHSHYINGLELLAQIIRAQDEPHPDDLQSWRDLIENKETVADEMKELREEVSELLLAGDLGPARRVYRRLAKYDPYVNSEAFITTHNSVKIVQPQSHENSENNDDE